MEGFGTFILDFLGEFAGGRGDPLNDLPRFGLSAIFWFVIWWFCLRSYKRYSYSRERWLLVGSSVALAQAVFMLTIKALKLYGVVPADTLELFFPPLDHVFTLAMRAVIAAAFIHYLVQSKQLAVTYLKIALALSALFYIVVAPIWWSTVSESPAGIKFSHFWGDWVAHSVGVALTLGAMTIFSRTRGWVFVTVIIVFSMYLLDDVLMLINLATNEIYKPAFAPIRHNLQLWAIPLFGYIYWREQAEFHDRLAKKQLQSDRHEVIGRLAFGIAHDFNNHLQAIIGFSELGLSESDPTKQEKSFDHIITSSERAAALVNQLLTFSRQKDEGTFENVYYNSLIPELIPMLQRIIGSQVTIHTDENRSASAIWIEKSMLEQIIINLAVNASDAMPDGGHIYLKTHDFVGTDSNDRDGPTVNRWTQLEISDTGEGIDGDVLAHIYEPFFTTKEIGRGTGLGLAIVQNIVQKMGGDITIKSELGIGTSIVVNLPASATDDDGSVEISQSEKLLSGSGTVLVAEDDEIIRGLTAGMLESSGYRVLTAADGQEAVKIAIESGHCIDLLVFDVVMPNLNGYLAYEKIIEDVRKIPVLFFTANTERATKFRPEYSHLIKPVGRVDFLTQVKAKMDASKSASKSTIE